MEKHLNILGWLHIVWSGIIIVAGLALLLGMVGGGMAIEEEGVGEMLAGIGTGVGLLIVLFGLPGLIGGIGVLRRQSWARVLIILAAIIALFSFPIGTILAIYTLWVVTRDEAKAELHA